jgi:hypothetical protein
MERHKSQSWPIRFTVVLAILAGVMLGAREKEPRVYRDETEAVNEGRRLGIGWAALDGPRTVEVMSHHTWTLHYTTGKAGLKPEGGLRITMRHLQNWSVPQTNKPADAGYLTARSSSGVSVIVQTAKKDLPPGMQYFPWQNMIQLKVPDPGLAPGETISVTYGDRSQGSPGMRVQPFDETHFVLKCYVDAVGDDEYLPLAEHPEIEVIAAKAERLSVIMPSDAQVGRPTWCIVRAEDRYGNPADSYRGTIRFRSTDNDAELPGDYTFTDTDQGAHRFEDVVFQQAGTQTIQAVGGIRDATGNPVCVKPERSKELLLWGDIHGHTLYSDGRGTVEEYYDFGRRVAGLDVCSVTDHAFEVLDPMWAHSKKVTNEAYEPGHFVTFQAFEWSGVSKVGGDHNVYFLEDDPPIYRSTSYYDPRNLQMYHGRTPKQAHVNDVFERLAERLTDKNVFTIPHYGGRKGNPEFHDGRVQRMIEVFSEHRRSEDWATTFLEKGYRMGVMASTDGHFGNPGFGYLKPIYNWETQEIGMAAVAIYAEKRTRESVFRALYDRHVYATSGDRIILRLHADGHPMGSEYRSSVPPTLKIMVIGTAPILRIEIKKNSKTIHVAEPGTVSSELVWRDADFQADKTSYYYVRIVQANDEEAISSPIWVN